MDQLLGFLRWIAALVYIDDVIVCSETWPEHMAHLRQLLDTAAKCGLTFSLPKCRFGFTELTMLGLGLSRYGLHTIEDRVRAVLDCPPFPLGTWGLGVELRIKYVLGGANFHPIQFTIFHDIICVAVGYFLMIFWGHVQVPIPPNP
jgi:hypothetical protein